MRRGIQTTRARAVHIGLLCLVLSTLGCTSSSAPLPGVDIASGTVQPSTGLWFDSEAGAAGIVRFTVVGDTLRLDSVRPNDGWTWRPDLRDTDDDVAIEFRHEDEDLLVDFESDIHDGVLLVEVETAAPADDATSEWPAATAVDVLLSVSDQRVTLDRITAADGWTWTRLDRDDVSIDFVHAEGALVAFEARTDDGRLEVEVETRWRPVLDDVLE